MVIVGQSECSFRFVVKPRTEAAPLVRNQKLDIGEFKEAIMRINAVMEPLRKQIDKNERILQGYLVGGLLLTLLLAVIFAVHVHFAVSIVLGLLYFVGLKILVDKLKQRDLLVTRNIHFNLALCLKNENERVFSRFGIKARPGYLSKWIELHWANPYSLDP